MMQPCSLWCSATVSVRRTTSCVCYITVAFGYVYGSVVKNGGLVAIRSLIVPWSVRACIHLQITQCILSLLSCCVTNPASSSHGITAYGMVSFPHKHLKFLKLLSVQTIATDGGLFVGMQWFRMGVLILVSYLSWTKICLDFEKKQLGTLFIFISRKKNAKPNEKSAFFIHERLELVKVVILSAQLFCVFCWIIALISHFSEEKPPLITIPSDLWICCIQVIFFSQLGTLPCQGGYGFASVGLFVCLSAGLWINCWPKCNESWWKVVAWAKEEPFTFRSGS